MLWKFDRGTCTASLNETVGLSFEAVKLLAMRRRVWERGDERSFCGQGERV
jgi:hypothetical protein